MNEDMIVHFDSSDNLLKEERNVRLMNYFLLSVNFNRENFVELMKLFLIDRMN